MTGTLNPVLPTHTGGGVKAKARNHKSPQWWASAMRRPVAAVLVSGNFLLGCSAVAHADPVTFLDQWVAHDSSLQLSNDGTGTWTLGDGALNTDQWRVTWKQTSADGITVTLASLLGRSGPGMGKAGDQYTATIQPDSAGNQVLHMHKINPDARAVIYCTMAELKTHDSECGA